MRVEPPLCKIQTMSGRGGMHQRHRQLAVVPSAILSDVSSTGERDVEFVQPLGDSGEIMLEPVGHQHGLAVCRFDQVLQRIQLAVMDMD
jgi:hypothetical protein